DVEGQRTLLSPTRALHPMVNTVSPVFPNEYAPLTSQAVYEDKLWRSDEAAADYASRTTFQFGGSFTAVSKILSGTDITRTADAINPLTVKYTMGSSGRAVGIR